eukprot:1489069-Prymnesium_polylepis.1
MRARAPRRASCGDPISGCPIWDFLCVPARYDAEFRGRFLGPRDFSLPLAGVTAHVRPALQGPPPGGHGPASHAGDAPG